ncbi:hypothetical protein ACFW5P_28360 [Streptomyces rochei]|uniref:hypothetical protein n=1 Tax=Streptomyces TaxID=1883 RepID=UPI0036AB6291
MLKMYVGPATVLMNGMEVAVEARLRYTPTPTEDGGRRRHPPKTWSGSLRTEVDVDLFDAAPGILRMPDGSEGEFMATSGDRSEVGMSGIGPAPAMLVAVATA